MPNGKRLGEQHSNAQDHLEMLVEKASQGNKDALGEICEKIAKSVLFKVTYILGQQSGVEDVSQEVLIRVCENIQNLRSPKAFKTWLNRIIVNEKNRYLAKNMRHGETLDIDDHLEETTEEAGEFTPQEYVESKELRHKVMQVVQGLPARQRETIILYYYEGLSVTEIAKVLDVTTQSVSKNLAVARGKLRGELGDLDGYPHRSGGQMGTIAILPASIALGEYLQRGSAGLAAEEACIQVLNTAQISGIFPSAPAVYGALAGACATVFAAATIVRVRGRPE